MLATLRSRLRNDEDGFTLIELMVVVLIIAILIAIAIPTFLGVQNRAKDRSAQSDLRNGLTAAKTIATDNAGKFVSTGTTPINAADLLKVEPSLPFVDSVPASVGKEVVVVTGAAGADVTLLRKSDSGTWFCISSDTDGKVTYNSDKDVTKVNTRALCANDKW